MPNSAFQLFFNVQCWPSIPFLLTQTLFTHVVIYLIQSKTFQSAYNLLGTILGTAHPKLDKRWAISLRVHLLLRKTSSFLLFFYPGDWQFLKYLLHILNFIHSLLMLFNFQSSRSTLLFPCVPTTKGIL